MLSQGQHQAEPHPSYHRTRWAFGGGNVDTQEPGCCPSIMGAGVDAVGEDRGRAGPGASSLAAFPALSSPQAFEEWNKTELDSFLIEITANILKFKDSDGKQLLPKIRDSAGQKGTGKWTAISALEYGVPVTLIGACHVVGMLILPVRGTGAYRIPSGSQISLFF